MALFYRILNFKFMHILCFDSFGRKYFVIFTQLCLVEPFGFAQDKLKSRHC
jgi:hypothetical protein